MDQSPAITKMLNDAEILTQMMRQHQSAVQRIGENRRQVIRNLREENVSFRIIAAACGVTDQALFADLRKHPHPS